MIPLQIKPNDALFADVPERETEAPVPSPAARGRAWRGWAIAGLLVLILLLGAVFRLTGVDWDQGTHLHPDERFLTMVVSTLTFPGGDTTRQPPAGCPRWGGYFDTACSPLDPYSYQEFPLFVYGTFPIFLTRFVGEVVGMTGYDSIHFVGRVLSALFDLSTVLIIFFIGRRLYGVRAGLLAALFLACSVLDIQQSHFFTVDTFTNVPILIAFWFALDIVERKRYAPSPAESLFVLGGLALVCFVYLGILPGLFLFLLFAIIYLVVLRTDRYLPASYVFAGIAFGLALAGRINIAPFAAVLVAAAALRAYLDAVASTRTQAARVLEAGPEPALVQATSDGPAIVQRELGPLTVSFAWRESAERVTASFEGALSHAGTLAFGGLVAAAILALIVFRVFQPYAANGPSFISPHLPSLDLSRGPVNFAFDVVLSWAGGVNPKFSDNMTYVSQLVAGTIDSPPGIQWTDRTPYVFPWTNMVEWGLGLPLGLVAWAGFLVALYQLIRYRRWEHLLVVVWVGITFGYTGQQFVKTMRYFLQIYPFLALLAGWLIVQMWDWAVAAAGWRRTAMLGSAGLVSLVVVGYTLFWASAFTTIYTRDYTRVAASEWIFDNVPPRSAIGNETWDDPLPTRVEGKDPFGGMYTGVDMSWYDEDTPEKRVKAIGWLDKADYVILSSNRLYGSIPREPMRWPMTTKYYQWLFDGTLGFKLVAQFASRPQLFGIQIADDNAEEAFTVYDHPKVLIFEKTPQYSHANAQALLGSVDLSEVYRLTPPVATQAKTALLLTPSDWTTQLRGGTWSQLFNPDDLVNRIPVIGWLVMIEVLGWLAVPIAFVSFRGLADRGYLFAKALGLLLPAWGAWMLASVHLVGFGRLSIAAMALLVGLIGVLLAWLHRGEFVSFLRTHWRVLVVGEVLFIAFYGLDLAIRYGNPDLWHPYFGGEKPMDFAYLNAISKSTWFPPYDPWFAGGYINYYYFGQLITAMLIRLSGIVPEVSYNLALPTYFALLAMGAFSVVYNLVSAIWNRPAGSAPDDETSATAPPSSVWPVVGIALLGAFFVTVIGNLGEIVLIGQAFAKAGGVADGQGAIAALTGLVAGIGRVVVGHQPLEIGTGSWYWNASRAIPDTINEFPFFTFLYADLHAHLMALPFTLLVMGFAVHFVLRDRSDDARLPFWPYFQVSPTDVLEIVVAALAVGSLRAINYADYVTYPLVIMAALVVGEYARRRTDPAPWQDRVVDGVIAVVWRAAAIMILASVLYQPFISHFATTSTSIELWRGAKTTLLEYLTVHGIFLFVIATFLVWQSLRTDAIRDLARVVRVALLHIGQLSHFLDLHRALAAPPTWYDDLIVVVAGGFVVIEGVLILMQAGVFAFVFPLLVLAGLIVVNPDLDPARRFVALLIAAGLALTLAVELVHYRDDVGRMNTVFKFYLEVWVFFAIASAVACASMIRDGFDGREPDARPAPSREDMLVMPERQVESAPSTAGCQAKGAPWLLPASWWAVFGVLLFCGFLYPVLATRAKVSDRFVANAPPGLNGMDYQLTATYPERDQPIELKWDHDAIEWLRQNIAGSPVILEGNGPLYQWTSRISINTGLPTVIGWDWHQKQQRSIVDGAIIDHRIQDVQAVYTTTLIPEAVTLLDRYRVSYIYVGDFERIFYGTAGMSKFDTMTLNGQLALVYQNDHVKIYQVINQGS